MQLSGAQAEVQPPLYQKIWDQIADCPESSSRRTSARCTLRALKKQLLHPQLCTAGLQSAAPSRVPSDARYRFTRIESSPGRGSSLIWSAIIILRGEAPQQLSSAKRLLLKTLNPLIHARPQVSSNFLSCGDDHTSRQLLMPLPNFNFGINLTETGSTIHPSHQDLPCHALCLSSSSEGPDRPFLRIRPCKQIRA